MSATCLIGNTKIFQFEQNAKETATYTISGSSIFEDGFIIDAISIHTQDPDAGTDSTIDIKKNTTSIIGGVNAAPQTQGSLFFNLSDTIADLQFASTDNIVVTVATAVSKSSLTFYVSETSPRSVTVS